jgi:hypothetical protein
MDRRRKAYHTNRDNILSWASQVQFLGFYFLLEEGYLAWILVMWEEVWIA